jgi:hypothetical protein
MHGENGYIGIIKVSGDIHANSSILKEDVNVRYPIFQIVVFQKTDLGG